MATIRKRGTKWQVRIQIKGFDQIAKSFSTHADAEAWGKITESEMIRGAYIKRIKADQTTLAQALDRYEREISANKRGVTQEAMRIKAWKAHKLAGKSLASLRSVDFAKCRDDRLKIVSPSTVRLELAIISNLFNVARKEWGFEGLSNPIEAIRLPTAQNDRNRLFYDGEESLLLTALEPNSERGKDGRVKPGCRNTWLKPLVLLALETAMRRGELLGLRWENIRLADRVAHLPLTKNGNSRNIPLSSKALEVLKGLPRPLRGPVFDLTPNAVKLGFVRAVKRARLNYVTQGGKDERIMANLHFHDLRHIAITRLADKLPNIIELAAVSGHQDVRMLKRYYHPKAEALAMKLG
jgi:integrase